MKSLDNLDDDVLMEILSHLNLRNKLLSLQVCRRWQRLVSRLLVAQKHLVFASDYSLRFVDVCPENVDYIPIKDMDIERLERLTRKVVNLASAEFTFVTIDHQFIDSLIGNCPFIRVFVFSNVRGIDDNLLKLIVDNYPETRKISLRNCDLTDGGLKYVVENLIFLEALDISENHQVTGESFDLLGRHIQSLDISLCESISHSGLTALVSRNGKHLKSLTTSSVITDEMMVLLCDNLQELEYFNCVYSCTREYGSQADLIGCIGGLHGLKTLILRETDAYYGSLDDAAVLKILKGCSRLKRLELYLGSGQSLVSDVSLALISDFCPLLQVLLVDNAENVTDLTLASVSKLQNLKRFDLVDAVKVTNGGIISVINSCLCLNRLWIGFDLFCPIVTNETLEACIEMAKKKPDDEIKIEFSETAIEVAADYLVPTNMNLRVSSYKQTHEGLRYQEICFPKR